MTEFQFPDEVKAEKPADEKPKAESGAESGAEAIKIEIKDDTPVQDRGKKPSKKPIQEVTDDELENYSKSAKQRIQRFTRGYHDERRAKEEALRERQAAETLARRLYEENQRLQKQLSTGSKAFIEQSKTAAESKLQAAEEKYRKAYESADTDAIIAAQKEITRATLEVEQAERMRPVEEPPEREFQAPAAQPQPSNALQERTQKWVDANKEWFGKNESMTQAAMALDNRLKRLYGEDYLGTVHYFKVIDRAMRKQFPKYFGSDEVNEAPLKKASTPAKRVAKTQVVGTPVRAKKPAVVVAPATRSTAPRKIVLTQSAVNLARRLGLTNEQYARAVAEEMRKQNG